jgi:hypothetical protein
MSGSSREQITFCGTQGEPITYDAWHRREMAAWATRESDPAVIDSIGIAETVELAKARFADLAGGYLSVWADMNRDSDQFTRWLEDLRLLVVREVGDLWCPSEWHVQWFERACCKKVEEALTPLIDEWESRAARLEVQHLEKPHLSLRSLLLSGGDLNLAATLDAAENAMDNAQRVLNWDSATPSRSPVNDAGEGKSKPEVSGLRGEQMEVYPDSCHPQTRPLKKTELSTQLPATEDERRDPDPGMLRQRETKVARGGGFPANMAKHRAIAQIASAHCPNWQTSKAWKKSFVLKAICAALDEASATDESGLFNIPENWLEGKNALLNGVPVKGWSDALEHAPAKLVTDQIANSLRMVLKDKGRES